MLDNGGQMIFSPQPDYEDLICSGRRSRKSLIARIRTTERATDARRV